MAFASIFKKLATSQTGRGAARGGGEQTDLYNVGAQLGFQQSAAQKPATPLMSPEQSEAVLQNEVAALADDLAQGRPKAQDGPTTTPEQRKNIDARSDVTTKGRAPQAPGERERRPTVYEGNDPAYLPNETPQVKSSSKHVTFSDKPLEERKHEPLTASQPGRSILTTRAGQLLAERDLNARANPGIGSPVQDLKEQPKLNIGRRGQQ